MMSKKIIVIVVAAIAGIVLAAVAFLMTSGGMGSGASDVSANNVSNNVENAEIQDVGSGGVSGNSGNDANSQSDTGANSMSAGGTGGSSATTETVTTTETLDDREETIRVQETLVSVLTQPSSMDAYNVSQSFVYSVPSQFNTPDNLAVNIIRSQTTASLTESCSLRDPVIESCDVVGSSFGYTTYRMRMRMFAYDISPQEAGMFIPDQTVTYDVTVASNQDGKIAFLSMDFGGYSDVRYL